MSHGKQFTLYSHGLGPNGWKVVFVLEELGLSYESKYLKFDKLEHKSLEHTKYNPNGRIPTLIDHWNNDFTIWESNAIIVYLVEKYDENHKISVPDFNEKMAQLQWLFFQSSGQGPYFGQAGWFRLFHPKKIPSAIERYQKEIIRVLGVLESVLSKQEWLVGGKCTIADLSFVIWNHVAVTSLAVDYNEFDFEKDFPAVHRWHSAMCSRESVCNALSLRDSLVASGQ
ncbi:glutathione S-transferase [Laetiporus sulphureus 93-53]|uniref:glutathione transferase n=1 Tax=Laetiporus sulphureus 93-53 TaxID=1314785 RepID=A0A165H6U8_9APHY|nr:glutathione S-transferase [Laetiporus sulphureus 93-53]KZT11323.1 glutathione S-transferase [Laetiporus sulphureus 93-53]